MKSWTNIHNSANLATSLLIHPTQHDLQSHNDDPQMSLDYHLVDPLGDDEKDEQHLMCLMALDKNVLKIN
jgi:hypothetical protein